MTPMSETDPCHFSPLAVLIFLLTTEAVAATDNRFDLSGSLIPADQIHRGGPPRGGIPAIDRPRFESASAAGFLDAGEPVPRLVVGGEARAYPIAIRNWHEVVNDNFNGAPVAVTYCLCAALASRIRSAVTPYGLFLAGATRPLAPSTAWDMSSLQSAVTGLPGLHVAPAEQRLCNRISR
jgi:hypothetical protein